MQVYRRSVMSALKCACGKLVEADGWLSKHLQCSNKKSCTKQLVFIGAPEWNRTTDLWLRRPTLYPAELRAQIKGRSLSGLEQLVRLFNPETGRDCDS